MSEKRRGRAPDRLPDQDEEPEAGGVIVDAQHENGEPLSERKVPFKESDKR
jgi:hypothetical protein